MLAHSGLSGHTSKRETYNNLSKHFEWSTMQYDVDKFCKQCLHCIGGRLGKKIPRPLASTVHGTFPNHVVRVDFVSMPYVESTSVEPFRGMLVMKDDHTQYCWLVPVKRETAHEVAKALLDWASKSKMPLMLAVDRGTHFINELIEDLQNYTGLVHIFPSVASNKQTHGGAENLNALVRKIFRCICSEKRLDTHEWPDVVHLVNHILNHRKSPVIGGIAPVELFTGQEADNQMDIFLRRRKTGKTAVSSLDQTSWYSGFHRDLMELRIMLNNLHRKALVSAEKKRADSRKQANSRRLPYEKFEIGDYVLRGIPEGSSVARRRNNLQSRWIGPYEVAYAKSDKVYICKDMLTGVLYEIHADYLHFYADQKFVVTGNVKRQLAFDTMGKKAVKILDFKIVNGSPLVKIKWQGVVDVRKDVCWHPISLATHLWPFHQVLGQLSQLRNNEAARKFVNKLLESQE